MAKSKTVQRRDSAANTPSITPGIGATGPALIFISHDSRDSELAEAFQNLLRDASGGILKSFCSSDKKGNTGIEFGEEWYKAIMKNLEVATNVVALLTKHSLDRPWILYEAGVAKGKLGTPVLGLIVGMPLEDANKGPFAQFQNCGDDEDSLVKLTMQLIKQHPDAEPREAAVRLQVKAFLETVATMPEGKTVSKKPVDVDPTIVAKLFEEIKVMFRDLPDKLDGSLQAAKGRARHPAISRVARQMLRRAKQYMSESTPDEAAEYWLLAVMSLGNQMPAAGELASQVVSAVKRNEVELARTKFRFFAEMFQEYNDVMHQHETSEDEFEVYHRMRDLTGAFEHYVLRRLMTVDEKMAARARKRGTSSPAKTSEGSGDVR